ncbi:SixA phosphatase family protein [Actinophytocola oryzae]|uniref:Phosphohistidine phosphatase n=1 Tax=Actinophytocola oryzae TaxID=502181 RepID=A0A4R7VMX8_9PSEU|nr:histidine phosphatase family protein [Actinophytocola oryzae]TDV50993.1 phosphohistidine phosphatase [Actinophytocola oryzae]
MDRILVVVRHAKSDWQHDLVDEERPLAPRGRREAPLIGPWVAANVGDLDLVVCSTAVRTRETLALSGLAAATTRFDERVYAAAYQDLMSVLDEVPDDVARTAVIGHNPGLSDLVRVLTNEPVELKTAAVAVLTWRGGWPDVWSRRASLVSHATLRG